MTDQAENPEVDKQQTPPTDNPTPPVDNPTPPVPQDWPNDFRERFAGEDKDKLAYATRYKSVTDLINAGYEASKVIAKGDHKKFEKPGKDATPEAIAEYRKNFGIPEAPEKYSLPEGVVLGEGDKPVFDAYFKAMHENNVPDDVAKTTVDWYYKTIQARQEQEAQEIAAFKTQMEQALKADWGADYKANYGMAETFAINTFGEAVGKSMLAAGADTVKALADVASKVNTTTTVVPNASNAAAHLKAEYDALVDESNRLQTKFPMDKRKRLLDLRKEIAKIE